MKWFYGHWQVIGVIGVLTLVAGLSLGRRNARMLPETPSRQSLTRTKTDGTMSTAAQTYGKVQHADDSNFDQMVLNSDVPVLVDFYADWCGPCQLIAPALEELARENPEAKIVKVDVDQSPQVAARYAISSIPSLKAFQDGQVVGEHVGMASKARLKALLGGH